MQKLDATKVIKVCYMQKLDETSLEKKTGQGNFGPELRLFCLSLFGMTQQVHNLEPPFQLATFFFLRSFNKTQNFVSFAIYGTLLCLHLNYHINSNIALQTIDRYLKLHSCS